MPYGEWDPLAEFDLLGSHSWKTGSAWSRQGTAHRDLACKWFQAGGQLTLPSWSSAEAWRVNGTWTRWLWHFQLPWSDAPLIRKNRRRNGQACAHRKWATFGLPHSTKTHLAAYGCIRLWYIARHHLWQLGRRHNCQCVCSDGDRWHERNP